jgi:hypothetical protein
MPMDEYHRIIVRAAERLAAQRRREAEARSERTFRENAYLAYLRLSAREFDRYVARVNGVHDRLERWQARQVQ